MNRELKFRCWDKDKSVFIPNNVWALIQTEFNAFGIMLKDWEDYREGEYFYDKYQELQQYTGLKDKNGKEIYEGDIVLNAFSSMYGSETHKEVVSYRNGYHFKHAGAHTNNQVIEVIGNIYENPELL